MRAALIISAMAMLFSTLRSQTIDVFVISAAEVVTQRGKTREYSDLEGRTASGDGWRASVSCKVVPLLIRSGIHLGNFGVNSDFGLDASNPSDDTKAFRSQVLLSRFLGIRKYPEATVNRSDITPDANNFQTIPAR